MTAESKRARSRSWLWWVCLILLLATFLNYANRFAFTQNALPIQDAFQTNKEGYGTAAGYFGLGFAFGGLLFGVLADLISVRLLYPLVVLAWSLAGISSGLVDDLFGLSVSRFVLGLFEAGHWPCALRTTQRIFKPHQRTVGNSILQSGASLGAVLTPLLVLGLDIWDPEQWKVAFFLVGGLGFPWALAWLWIIRESDVRQPVIQTDEINPGPGEERELQEIPFFRIFLSRRWWVLLLVVVCINTLWHYIRVWMPDTLEDDHGYSHRFVQSFTSMYYLATFFGSLASGWLTAWLVGNGWNVFRSRLATFFVFALLSTCSIAAAFLPRGPLLLGTLLIVAFGSLGLFPIYYSLNQEISARHQGKVGGSLSFSTWGILYFVHPAVGRLVDANQAIRPYLFAAVGLGPLLACAALVLFWGSRPTRKQTR
jgi:ACS family hexuronate transporter-like MFS transporter